MPGGKKIAMGESAKCESSVALTGFRGLGMLCDKGASEEPDSRADSLSIGNILRLHEILRRTADASTRTSSALIW